MPYISALGCQLKIPQPQNPLDFLQWGFCGQDILAHIQCEPWCIFYKVECQGCTKIPHPTSFSSHKRRDGVGIEADWPLRKEASCSLDRLNHPWKRIYIYIPWKRFGLRFLKSAIISLWPGASLKKQACESLKKSVQRLLKKRNLEKEVHLNSCMNLEKGTCFLADEPGQRARWSIEMIWKKGECQQGLGRV